MSSDDKDPKVVRHPGAQSPGLLDQFLQKLTENGLLGKAIEEKKERKSKLDKQIEDASR